MMNQILIHQHGVTGREHSEAAIGWILMRFLSLLWPSQLRFGCGFAALCSLWLKSDPNLWILDRSPTVGVAKPPLAHARSQHRMGLL